MSSAKDDILRNLKSVIASVYETDTDDVDINVTFLEMGLDSISIIQVKQLVKNEYGFDVAVDRLFNDISNLDQLADFIKAKLPAEPEAIVVAPTQLQQVSRVETSTNFNNNARQSIAQQPVPITRPVTTDGKFDLQSIINDQLQLMQRQMDMLARLGN